MSIEWVVFIAGGWIGFFLGAFYAGWQFRHHIHPEDLPDARLDQRGGGK